MRILSRLLLLSLLFSASAAFGLDRWIPIAGTVGAFHTDVRVLNPSTTKDIQVVARFLPIGNADNNAAIAGAGVTLTIPKRQMRVLDDVTTLFNTTQLGAILLVSADNFTATSRIYAQTAAGTLGQFFIAESPGLALTKGVLLQLDAGTSAFRTNLGVVNTANATTTVTWRLYDKNNAVVATATSTMPAYAVIGPTNLTGLFSGTAGFDLSDSWVSFTSTNPVFAYASVVDNSTTDPTSIPAQQDTGEIVDQPAAKTYDVTLVSFEITITPPVDLRKGDQATFRIRSTDGTHGFQLNSPNGVVLVPLGTYVPGTPAREFTFTAADQGTYNYFCTNTSCGEGHEGMLGSFNVGNTSGDPGRDY